MKKLLIFFILLSSLFAKSEPVTKEDMQMMFGMFQKSINAQFKRVDERFNNIEAQIKMTNKRIDDIHNIILALLGGIFVLIGFMWWDRRTLIYKAKEEMDKSVEQKLEIITKDIYYQFDQKYTNKTNFEKVIDFIRDLAKTNKEYENILNKHGLKVA